MKLNLKKSILDQDDKPMKDGQGELMYNKLLATILWSSGNENIMKFYDWGNLLWKKGEIDVDRTDLDIIKTLVEKTTLINVFLKGRFLDEFKLAK